MRTSETINELADALAKAQSAIEGAVRGNVNPAFRSRYADLGAVWDAIREPMTAAGIAVVQALGTEDGKVSCTTRLMKGGQWIESDFAVPVGKHDAQGFGSAATYVRRYALMAMVGIAPIDDDGNASIGSKPADAAPLDAAVVASLRGAKTIDDLQEAWKAIPANVRSRYAAEKDAAKARIGEAEHA